MMKSLMKFYSIFIITIFFLAACGSDEDGNSLTSVSTNETGQTEEVAENHVRLTITIDQGNQYVNEREVEVEEGTLLINVLEESFYIETNDENELISIERMAISEEEGTNWVLIVDGEQSAINPSEYTVSSGEKITLDLQ